MAEGKNISDADRRLSARMMNEGEKTVSDADVIEALGISMTAPTGTETDNFDRSSSARVLKMATKDQKAMARDQLGVPEGMNMGGVMRDELGYMNGGMSYNERGPIKYSKGGAVKGKTFRGSY
mgnify:FL=1|jgi:hypothetical protein|tara:strand:- start:16 stop:384 length:369 start_codon:yes stop_codon:yes gene_type:complete